MRDALAHAGKNGRRVASAFIGTAFAQDDAEAARLQWRRVADELRPKLPKLRPRRGRDYVLASMSFPAAHRAKLHSTNPIERLNGEIKGAPQSVGSVRGPVMSRRILEILARAISLPAILPHALQSQDQRLLQRYCHSVETKRDLKASLTSLQPKDDAVAILKRCHLGAVDESRTGTCPSICAGDGRRASQIAGAAD
jgi:hypothetical protein